MNRPKLVVGITQGDSNGIGYEVLIKSLADSRILDSFTLHLQALVQVLDIGVVLAGKG